MAIMYSCSYYLVLVDLTLEFDSMIVSSSDALPSAAMLGSGGGRMESNGRGEGNNQGEEDFRQPSVDGLASPNSPGTKVASQKQGKVSLVLEALFFSP